MLCHEPLLAYLPAKHPLAERERVRQTALVDEHVWLLSEGHCFRTQALHLCSIDRRPRPDGPSVTFDGGSFDTLTNLVDAGLGVTIVPELLAMGLSPARRSAQLRRFAEPEPHRQISFLVARAHLRRAVADGICELVTAAVPRELKKPRPPRSILPP